MFTSLVLGLAASSCAAASSDTPSMGASGNSSSSSATGGSSGGATHNSSTPTGSAGTAAIRGTMGGALGSAGQADGPSAGANGMPTGTAGSGGTGVSGAAGMSGAAGAGGASGVTALPANLALNKPTLPESMGKLVDGSLTTGEVNFGSAGSFVIDLGKATTVGRAIFGQIGGHAFAQSISFAASDDLQTWKDVWSGHSGPDFYMFLEAEVTFAPVTTRYFRASYSEPFIDGFIVENELELYAPDSTSANLALNKPVTSNVATKYSTPLGSITDGKLDGDPWHADSKPGSITVDLGSAATVNRLRLLSDTHNATTQSAFDLSLDGVTWTSVFPNAGQGMHHIAFGPQQARYIRCNILEVNLSDVGAPGLVVRELQVYGPAR